MKPLISICIPTYKSTFLVKLLQSIEIQTFKDYEVIVTDDSPGDEIAVLCREYATKFPLRYYKNSPAKGTPANWNQGISLAGGEWIKIIHHDDWFTDANSLKTYVDSIGQSVDCIFSGYQAYYENSAKLENKTITQDRFKKIVDHPYYLFAANEIGPPSVIMFKKNIEELYDPALKWLVDFEAYVRMMKRYTCIYISAPLITMSYNENQVTNDCFRNPDVEVREALIYYKKNGSITHQKLMTYDAWWRMLRNLNIRNKKDLVHYAKGETVPVFLLRILSFQQKIPASILSKGVFSKLLMSVSYLLNQ
jgi:glycosyltransferase involved in cell wall biosynthesis